MLASGQLTHAAEQGDQPDGGAKGGLEPQQRRDGAAERGADEKGGHDLPAAKARAERERGEQHLQQEGKRRIDPARPSAAAMPALPAPLYAPLPSINDSATTSTPPASTRRYRFGSSR